MDQYFHKLGERANVEIHTCQPSRKELEEILEQSWEIIYYGGHSETLDLEKDAILFLEDETTVKISELEDLFHAIIKTGKLRLLIANSCQGLGIAFRLVNLGLSQALVMRESIPDDLAHDFLRYLLESFILGLGVTSTVYHCKPHLREAYDLRHQLPGASLLPALCLATDAIKEIDNPLISLEGLHPICQEMRALANLAKARLTLENILDLEALRVQEYYAELLQHKNKVGRAKTTTEVDLEQIYCSEPKLFGQLIWQIDFLVKIHKEELVWGQGYVNIKSGHSELLLDVRPWTWTGFPVVIDGQEIEEISFPKGTKFLNNNQVIDLSFTRLALVRLEEEYKKYARNPNFTGVKEVVNFGGWLKDINKKKFLLEWVKLRHQGNDNAVNEAYKKTPFGRHRIGLGITEFKIELPEEKMQPLTKVMEQDNWTAEDFKYLKDAGVNPENWANILTPEYIIVSSAKRP